MPQGSRKGTRSNNNNNLNISNNSQKNNDSDKSFHNITSHTTADNHLIKHAHIPSIPNCNMALFHFMLLVFSLTSTLMQYLHIYRTVWWLPQSHAKKALNFYLIDSHLFGYLITIETVPFLYSLYKQIMTMEKKRIWFIICFTICITLWMLWFTAFLIFSFCVYNKTTGFYLLILFYPPIAYGLIYCHYIPHSLFLAFKSRLLNFLYNNTYNYHHNYNNRQYNQKSSQSVNSANISIAGQTDSDSNPLTYNKGTTNESNSVSPNSKARKSNTTNDSTSPATSIGSTTTGGGGGTVTSVGTAATSTSSAPASSLSSSSTTTPATTSTSTNNHINNSINKPSPTQLALEQYGIFYYSKTIRHACGGYVQHNCTMNPEEIRDEVEKLKSDFNRKFRDIFFGTLFTFFYASLVPLLFVPKSVMTANGTIVNAVHYDGIWCGQHVFVTAITAFLLYSVQHLSPGYVDVLHRCALHLGRWRREEGRTANVPYNVWSQLQIFPRAALVKHVRGLFRAVGAYNSAEPGNNMHNRFFFFFYPALRLANVMCVLVLLILALQYALLVHNYEWYKIISVAAMMFFNVCSLYKILRNRFLLSRCYKEESIPNNTSTSTTATIGPTVSNSTINAPLISSHIHHVQQSPASNVASHHPCASTPSSTISTTTPLSSSTVSPLLQPNGLSSSPHPYHPHAD